MVNSSSTSPASAVGTTQWSSARHRQIRTLTFWGVPLYFSQCLLFIGVFLAWNIPVKCTSIPMPGPFGKHLCASLDCLLPLPRTRWELLDILQCFHALLCPSPWQSGMGMAQEWGRAAPFTGQAAVTWRQQPGARVLQCWALRWPLGQSNWWR